MSARALIIIPTFNERENIASLVERILALYSDVEVLVVDDRSPDGTADAVRAIQQKYDPRLHLIVREGKGGRGSAVLAGFAFALARDYPLVMEMDADFSHNPEEIATMLKASEHADVVVASRYLPQSKIYGWGGKRRIFSRWANRYARFVLGIPLTDYTNGFRCYKRSSIEAIDPAAIRAKGYVVLSEIAFLLHRKGKTFTEVPTVFVNRRRGQSNLSAHEIREALGSVWHLRFPPKQ